jgi:hypothetical protein
VGRTFYGHLDGVSADSIRIRTPGANDRTVVAAIPRDSVTRFEVNHPGGRRTVVGALAGMGAGFLVGDLIATSNCIIFCTAEQQQQNANALELGTVVGGVIGALTGAAIRSTHWRQVPVDRISVTMRSASGGLGLGLTLRF